MKNYTLADVSNKVVLMRVDFNVPIHKGVITDSTRIDASLHGIKNLLARNAKLILLSHFGRPKGKTVPELSLLPISQKLSELLNQKVHFVTSMDLLTEASQSLQMGEVALLENLRFYSGEEANDIEFTEKLGNIGDIYINDAFSAAHRAHASTQGLANLLPAFSGPLLESEVAALTASLETPKRPLAAIIGGAKISSKIQLLQNLTRKADILVIAGGMANVFLKADNIPIGKSLCEEEALDLVSEIKAEAKKNKTLIILPIDGICATNISGENSRLVNNFQDIMANEMILDAGPNSLTKIITALENAQTIIMNGPLGMFEVEAFRKGSNELCQYLAKRAQQGCQVIAGGGDTVAAVKTSGLANEFSYLSTAGGAFLEWLEGKKLPGIVALG